MITDSFDNKSPAKIQLNPAEQRLDCDACIITFSSVICRHVLENFPSREFTQMKSSCGPTPLYLIDYHNARLAFYLTGIGAPYAAALLEEAAMIVNTKRFIAFGGSGCLNKEIAHGKVMVPTFAYRDEGTSYHYAAPADRIELPGAGKVAEFMEHSRIPYVTGGTWTTDAIYRETEANFQKHKAEGCIAVEMECSALQAVCNFRGYELYYFLTSGDLLDAPKWDPRRNEGDHSGTQHDVTHFEIAAGLARYVSLN